MTEQAAAQLSPDAFRNDFPILARNASSGEPLVFLDNAASTQRPNSVIDAMSECYREYYANVHRGIHTLSEASTEKYESARLSVQRFLHAKSAEEIVFTAGTTAAINTVARTWGDQNVSQNDVILLPISEHHANIVPWHQLAERVGCRVEFLPINDQFCIDDSLVEQALAKFQPKLFAFAATSNVLGTDYPVTRWTQLAHQHGASVLVDAAQAAPHRPIDVTDWDCDFAVFSGHKICGPTGIGVLYGKHSLLKSMPPFLGGGAMIDLVTTDGFTTAACPEKFEAGTPPIVEAIGLAAAIDYIESVGLDAIHAHEKRLCKLANDAIAEIDGVHIYGPDLSQRSGIVSFTIDRIHAHDIAQWLDRHGVAVRAGHHCAMPLHQQLGISASVRASFYLYNNDDDVERLIHAITDVKKKFGGERRRRRSRA